MTDVLPGDPTDPLALESRPPPLGTEPDVNRQRGRERRILKSGVASSASQILAAAGTLVTVPMVVHRLPPDAFGVWITLSSLIILLGFLDLGIGSALVGGIARAEAAGDHEHGQRMVSSAFFGLLGLSLLLAVVFALLYPHVSWGTLLGVATPAVRRPAAISTAIVVVAILLSIPLNVAARAQAGMQEGEVVALWRSIGTVVQLLLVGGMFLARATLPWFVLALAAGPVVGSLLNSFALFRGRRRWLHPKRSHASLRTFRRLGAAGFLFFVLLLSSTVAYQSDALVIAHYLGSTKAGEYGVPFRLFLFVPNLVNLALMPLWPAYADAWESRDIDWIRRTFRRSVLFALSANGVVSLGLLVLARPILRLWVGDATDPSTFFLVTLFVYVLVWSLSGPVAMLLNGCGVVKFQLAVSVAMVAVNLPLSIALLPSLDVAGPVVGTIVSQVVIILVPAFVYQARLLRQAAGDLAPAPVA